MKQKTLETNQRSAGHTQCHKVIEWVVRSMQHMHSGGERGTGMGTIARFTFIETCKGPLTTQLYIQTATSLV